MSLLNQTKQRFLYLDSIRALVALYVVMHHAMLQYYFIKSDHLSKTEKLVYKVFSDGHLAVDMFIVLSGFSLMLAIIKNNYQLKGGTSLFIKRRIIRIVPAYYATLIISLLFAATCIGIKTSSSWDMSINANMNDLISHLLFFHDFFLSTSPKINYSLWSIAVEFRLYLIFPFIVWLWRKRGAWSAFLFAFVTAIGVSIVQCIFKIYNSDINLFRSGVSPLIILFTLGMLAADISFSDRGTAVRIRDFFSKLNNGTTLIVFIVLIIIYKVIPAAILSSAPLTNNLNLVVIETKDILCGIITAVLLAVCATGQHLTNKKKSVLKILNWQPLVFIGTFSYSLYLIHAPLLQILSQYVLSPLHLSVLGKTCLILTFGTPLVVFISYLFFLLFERPFLISNKDYSIKNTEAIAAQNPAI